MACIPLPGNKAQCIQVLHQNASSCVSSTTHVWLSWARIKDWKEKKKLLNKIVIFVFFAHKMYSRSFITLMLNHWWNGLFYQCPYYVSGPWTRLLRCDLCRVRKLSDFFKNILICVPNDTGCSACGCNPWSEAWACRNICVQQAPDVSVDRRVQLFVRSVDAFHPWVACGWECYLA